MSNQLCTQLEAFMLSLQFCRMLKGVYLPCSNSALLLGIQFDEWLCLPPQTLQLFSGLHFLPCSFWTFVGQLSLLCPLWEVCVFSWPQLVLPSEVCRPKWLHQMPVLFCFPVFSPLSLPSMMPQALSECSSPISLVLCMVTSWFTLPRSHKSV